LEVAPRVHFCGFVREPEQLAAIYNLGQVFITACEVETQGMVLLEASACGLPVVAYRAGGIPEVVLDGVTGMLATAGEVAELAERLQNLLDHPDLARRMGSAGRRLAETHSLENTLEKYDLCYRIARLHMQVMGSWEIAG
jgi:glycosyltransferase involved in cell wall biosynthesis